MSADARTIVVDGVRLTEAQVRAAVKALEAPPPPPPLTRADIKPGKFYSYVGMPEYTYLGAVPYPSVMGGDVCGVSKEGSISRSSLGLAVVRRTSFTDTGSA